ncbi:Protein CBG22344 [Caenorhabditis briggsae]|uniref:Protein CBG22344 n=2 Tax=Caenorhabditis briggsae TaxID=6238 RepID=A8Y271_CAEBR|nr:Protein CBG22344 [Caenorhabditis briggsae]ULT93715.1 hypothetical protein L3Y34_003302 [Caenorhabditis briggsae]CAP38963.1 Protein CBG22344 [Caenorhabditis briggsae]
MKFFILVASFLVILVAGAPTSTSDTTENLVTQNVKNCEEKKSTENEKAVIFFKTCTRAYTWQTRHNDECNISTYYKKTVTTTPETSTEPLNGVAQCTKTPCDASEKITVDCATAFGERLSEIEN